MKMLDDPASSEPVARLVADDPNLRRAYGSVLAVAAKMTNPPGAGARDLLQPGEGEDRRIFVPSRSHEADLVRRLYGDRPIPDGFDLAEEIAGRVKAGSLSLAPREDSGWYDYQTWALEPLVAPDRALEAARTRLSADYRRHLRELFKGLLALTRETHVKQLEPVSVGAAVPTAPVRIFVCPELTVEPLATYYVRRAASYRFVRGVLQELFGPTWRDLAFTDLQTAWTGLDEGLEGMEALFHGAHVRVCRELGLESDGTALPDRSADSDDRSFRDWVARIGQDPDLARDSRMMVPVFYDVERRRMKVWALLGWSDRPLTIAFHRPPRVVAADRMLPAGRLEELRRRFRRTSAENAAPQVEFERAYHRVSFPVTAELYVEDLLDRDSFRSLCDKLETRPAILMALAGR
jgi:hypothetical protein